jgi:DNA mismatch repair ATPase MutS
MSFNIDKQTIEELNLLGKFREGSVYGLFNKVKTAGGGQLLNEMFNNPLEKVSAISMRSSVFRFFEGLQPVFPFDVQQIALMRDYLDTNAGKSALTSLAGILKNKWLAMLIRDERYKKTIQGLQATVVTLSRCYDFLDKMKGSAGPYSIRIKDMLRILSDKRLEKLRGLDIYQELPVKNLAFFDHLLKTSLCNEMKEVVDFIYELDVNIAVSSVSKERGFVYANALPPERNILSATGLAHPCLNDAIGNTIHLSQDNNLIFLTGANMAGKSTLMKTVGIGLYLAHMGFPVAAEHMAFSVRDGMYSSINVADSIDLGYSHFYAEVMRVKQAAEATASGKRLLLMFDELFKGTNVKDAYDGTLAVTEAFAAYDDCLFIVSTHIIEVGDALKDNPNIQFVYMPTVMQGATPNYTYKLQKGITEDRQGMMIIRNEGILDLLEIKNA